MRISEEERDLPIFDIYVQNIFYCLSLKLPPAPQEKLLIAGPSISGWRRQQKQNHVVHLGIQHILYFQDERGARWWYWDRLGEKNCPHSSPPSRICCGVASTVLLALPFRHHFHIPSPLGNDFSVSGSCEASRSSNKKAEEFFSLKVSCRWGIVLKNDVHLLPILPSGWSVISAIPISFHGVNNVRLEAPRS